MVGTLDLDFLHVALAETVEAWCGEYLTQVPWFIPSRYPTPEHPDIRDILDPHAGALGHHRLALHFASDADAFHFKLRWW
jgi:hypothetical protein